MNFNIRGHTWWKQRRSQCKHTSDGGNLPFWLWYMTDMTDKIVTFSIGKHLPRDSMHFLYTQVIYLSVISVIHNNKGTRNCAIYVLYMIYLDFINHTFRRQKQYVYWVIYLLNDDFQLTQAPPRFGRGTKKRASFWHTLSLWFRWDSNPRPTA